MRQSLYSRFLKAARKSTFSNLFTIGSLVAIAYTTYKVESKVEERFKAVNESIHMLRDLLNNSQNRIKSMQASLDSHVKNVTR
ncbi:hypothetical protein M501DRAFT_994011 [Patellaria atrata CBS 101060]|uniref:Uncharacterized protein n=1 Tax=Patellaria atrata CBS 101060 TaxID=1346257 RepID=A0A9P4SJW1_9PEZI|nr:hypothetical protein M501DRAFT_994011 [Patellaria atrata CBS 101060]